MPMKVDHTILEKIRQYYSDELSAEEMRNVESLFDSDEAYAYHEKLFRVSKKGIKEAVNRPGKKWMENLDQQNEEPENSVVVRELKKKENSNTRNRRLWMLAASFIPLSFFLYFGLSNLVGNLTKELPILVQNQKAEDFKYGGIPEELPLFDDTISMWRISENKNEIIKNRTFVQLKIFKTTKTYLQYQLNDGQLNIFIPDQIKSPDWDHSQITILLQKLNEPELLSIQLILNSLVFRIHMTNEDFYKIFDV